MSEETKAERRVWPLRQEAEKLGCSCRWWGYGYIVEFDPACPILDRHKRSNDRGAA